MILLQTLPQCIQRLGEPWRHSTERYDATSGAKLDVWCYSPRVIELLSIRQLHFGETGFTCSELWFHRFHLLTCSDTNRNPMMNLVSWCTCGLPELTNLKLWPFKDSLLWCPAEKPKSVASSEGVANCLPHVQALHVKYCWTCPKEWVFTYFTLEFHIFHESDDQWHQQTINPEKTSWASHVALCHAYATT